jgi:hypothetical protein
MKRAGGEATGLLSCHPSEIGDRLVIRNRPTGEPHHLNVAGSFTRKPAARLRPID